MDSSARTPTRATPTLCAPSATSAGALAPSWRRAAVVVSAVGAGVLLWAATAAAAPIAWKACKGAPGGLQCARVAVPLDWSQPGGRTISLSVIRRPASRPAQRIGSLFVNFGGPGVAGVATVKRLGPRLNRLGRGRFDVVSWDPRGAGESTRISCFANDRDQLRFWGAFAIPVTSAQSKRLVRRTTAFARRCTERNRGLIPFLSTADTVRDLDHLRELVGDAQLNYRGISYGTFIGQTYANLFPDRVRAMVLDGNINPFAFTRSVQAASGSSIIDTDRVIGRKFFELCRRAGPARCALARGGSPARRFARLLARLRRGPIPAPAADPPRLSYSDLLIRIFLAEGTPAGWPDFARELDRAARGDGSAMAQMVQGARPLLEDALNSAVGLQCADKPVPPLLGPEAWPEVIRRLVARQLLQRPDPGMVAVGAVRGVEDSSRQPLRGPVDRGHPESGPRDRHPLRPAHDLPIFRRRGEGARKRGPADPRRLWPHLRRGPQRLHPAQGGRLPHRTGDSASGDGLPVRSPPLQSQIRAVTRLSLSPLFGAAERFPPAVEETAYFAIAGLTDLWSPLPVTLDAACNDGRLVLDLRSLGRAPVPLPPSAAHHRPPGCRASPSPSSWSKWIRGRREDAYSPRSRSRHPTSAQPSVRRSITRPLLSHCA